MINLSKCKTYTEAIEKIIKNIDCGECNLKIIIYKGVIVGVSVNLGGITINWKRGGG